MNSAAAISLFERPSAARAATRSSVSVSSVRCRLAPADPPELAACLVRPQARAELLEDRERLLERLPGRPSSAPPAGAPCPGRAAYDRARAGRDAPPARPERARTLRRRRPARRRQRKAARGSVPKLRAPTGFPCGARSPCSARGIRARSSSSPIATSVSIASAQTGTRRVVHSACKQAVLASRGGSQRQPPGRRARARDGRARRDRRSCGTRSNSPA